MRFSEINLLGVYVAPISATVQIDPQQRAPAK
jgi:hypothetical protein